MATHRSPSSNNAVQPKPEHISDLPTREPTVLSPTPSVSRQLLQDELTTLGTHSLTPDHLRELQEGSGISLEAIEARGYFSLAGDANGREWLHSEGFDTVQSQLGECLVIPLWNWKNELGGYAIKPKIPRNAGKGRARKYELPPGSTPMLDIARLTHEQLGNPSKDLIITEGAKKADCAATHGLCAISLNGVYGFRGKNLEGGIKNLQELDEIAWKGIDPRTGEAITRRVLLCFDSDWNENDSVYSALRRLAGALTSRGAQVKMVTLLAGPNGEKTGLDDYFVRQGTVDGLYKLATDLIGVAERNRQKRAAKHQARALAIANAAREKQLPIIETSDKQMHDILTPMAKALETFNGEHQCLFHAARGMAHIAHDKDDRAFIAPVTPEVLQSYVAESAYWVSTSDTGGTCNIAPPKDMCNSLLQRRDLWRGIRPLESVTAMPFFASDGTLCATRGYHSAARTWLDLPADFELPSTDPTPANIAKARRLIFEDILKEVAFAEQASRAHAIALILQPFMRLMIKGATPIYLFDAPVQSSGKSYAAEICILPFCPNPNAMNDISHVEEWEKSIFTAFLEGRSHLFFDNITSSLSSPVLASYVTSERKGQRILGKNENMSVWTWGATWVATSNNAILTGDAVSRILPIRLDTSMERPENRHYSSNPKLFIQQNRAQVAGAAICLIRAWIEAGSPLFKTKKHRFQEWSEILGGILELHGIGGFLDNLSRYRDLLSEENQMWRDFVGAWAHRYGGSTRTAKELLVAARDCGNMAAKVGADELSAQRMGQLLGQKRDQIFDGWKIERDPQKSKEGVQWRLLKPNSNED